MVSAKEWNEFVLRNSTGYVFHLYEMIVVDEQSENVNISFAIRDTISQAIVLLMPLFFDVINKKLVSRYGVVSADCLPRHYKAKLQNFFSKYMETLLAEHKICRLLSEQPALCQYNSPDKKENVINPFYYLGFKPCMRYCWVVNLQKSEEQILAECEETTRQAIRMFLSEEEYVFCCLSEAEAITRCEEFITLSEQTYNRSAAQSKSYSYYQHLFQNINNISREVYYIKQKSDDKMIVGAIVSLYNDTAQYSYGASLTNKPNGISKFLFYKIMLDLKRRGIRYFETGGAYSYLKPTEKLRGISDFKKSFGTFLHTIHMGEFYCDLSSNDSI